MLTESQLAAIRPFLSRSIVGQQALQSDPWQFVPAALARARDPGLQAALRVELNIAIAVGFARLGLWTLASEAIGTSDHAGSLALSRVLDRRGGDAVAASVLESTVHTNLAALPVKTRSALGNSVPLWRSVCETLRAFRTSAGVVVIFGSEGRPVLFVDGHRMTQALHPLFKECGPFYLDGVHAPDAAESLWHATKRPSGSVQPRMVLIAASPVEALIGLSLRAMPNVFASPRVELWMDLSSPQRLHDETQSRMSSTLGWAVTVPAPPMLPAQPQRWATGEVSRVLRAAVDQQDAEVERVSVRIAGWDSSVVDDSRAERLLGRGNEPARVLIFTTRYSTYVRHAAADLGEVLHRSGCVATVSMEPDDHSAASALGVLSAVEQHRPDVIILINTLRSQLPDALPRGIPVVTWVQDAMPHLFDERSGGAFGDRDFLVGHLHREMFEQFGFPRSRALSSVVLASDVKFHDARAGDEARARFGCEIGYISHQSETPESFRDRVLKESGAQSTTGRLMSLLYPRVLDLTRGATIFGRGLVDELHDATRRSFREVQDTQASAQAFALALHTIAHPLAERALRQQMMHWAADLCERKGWRLHIYGKGWEQHERFGAFAQGELPHGDDLRLAYQCAAVQLHAGLGGVHHQRVMECALSGGCTLVRIKAEDVRLLEWWAQNEVARCADRSKLTPAFKDRSDYFLCPTTDHWQAAMVQLQNDRLGVPPQHDRAGQFAVHADQLARPWRDRGGAAMAMEEAWLAGDLAEVGFWDQDSFNRVATCMVESPARRASIASWQREAVRGHCSLSSMIRGVVQMVGSSLNSTARIPATRR